MSTIAFAKLTTKREDSPIKTSSSTNPPGVSSYVDALAALVPAEILTLHGLILAFTTDRDQNGKMVITHQQTLLYSFYGCIILVALIYIWTRYKKWTWRYDVIRTLIPMISFVAWTMIQRTTAFDAACPTLQLETRTVIAMFVAVALGGIATVLAKEADGQQNS